MTEAEWLACSNPNEMRLLLEGIASDRKLRLFAAACCRRVWALLSAEGKKAVEVAERYADGQATAADLALAHTAARDRYERIETTAEAAGADPSHPASPAAFAAVMVSSTYRAETANNSTALVRPFLANPSSMADLPRHKDAVRKEWAAQAGLLRDIFGLPPFRPLSIAPALLAWNDRALPRLAQSIYEEPQGPEGMLDSARFAVLADTLLDADCDDVDLWGHCCQLEPHVRGCWALDLILGKS